LPHRHFRFRTEPQAGLAHSGWQVHDSHTADSAPGRYCRIASIASFCGEKTMASTDRARRSYAPPRLAVYGLLEELTLTVNDNMNKNDAIQGGNNLKT
jgi:hypothetical protein